MDPEKDGFKKSNKLLEGLTGFMKSSTEGKVLWNLLPTESLKRIAVRLTHGAEQYGAENWKKGIDDPEAIQKIKDALHRHTMQYINNEKDEDHLAAIGCNIMFLMYFEVMKKEYPYPEVKDGH